MSNSVEDLLYFANVKHDINQFQEATEYLKQLVEMNSNLDKETRKLFGIIFKDAIDPVRNTLRILRNASQRTNSTQAELLNKEIDASLSDLNSLCQKALTLINNYLEPNAEDFSAKTFYYKMKGDLYRYLYEFNDEDKEELLQKADSSYRSAIDVSSTELNGQDPIRLGSILNYAVLLYEHMKKEFEAVKILKDALNKAQDETKTLSENSKKESVTIINVMQSNLSVWERGDDGEEEDELDAENPENPENPEN